MSKQTREITEYLGYMLLDVVVQVSSTVLGVYLAIILITRH